MPAVLALLMGLTRNVARLALNCGSLSVVLSCQAHESRKPVSRTPSGIIRQRRANVTKAKASFQLLPAFTVGKCTCVAKTEDRLFSMGSSRPANPNVALI